MLSFVFGIVIESISYYSAQIMAVTEDHDQDAVALVVHQTIFIVGE